VPSSKAVPRTGNTLSYFKGILTRLFHFVVRITVVISIFGGFIWYMTKSDDDREASAQAAVAPYNAQMSRYLKKNFVAEGRLPAKGKIVVVDGNTRSSDKFSNSNLGRERQPTGPSDVDSVVLHKCRYDQVGSYSNGSRALQHVCTVDVIDVASGGWSSWGEFLGTAPPSEIKRKRGSTSDEMGGGAIRLLSGGRLGAPLAQARALCCYQSSAKSRRGQSICSKRKSTCRGAEESPAHSLRIRRKFQ
jgi:hypothetical protein